MLANLTPCEMLFRLSCEGIRTLRDGGDLLFFGQFEKLTAEDRAVLRESKPLLMYFDADGELDYCPDGWPRLRSARPIVIGADGGVGPPPANV